MASIVQRKDRGGQWCVYYYDELGRRRGRFFPAHAKRKAKRFAAAMDATAGRKARTVTLETAVVYFVEDRQSCCSAGTFLRYRCVLLAFARDIGEKTPLDRIATHDLDLWRNQRMESRARSSVRNDLKTVKAFFHWCAARGWIAADPSKPVEIPIVKRGLPAFLTPAQLDALIDRAREHDRPEFYLLTCLCVEAGLRRNEALHLPWSAVDFDRRVLHIVGKSKSPRVVPMSPLLEAALLDWPQDGALVFPPRYKCANVCSPFLAREYNAWLASLGMGIKSMHALRHSFASRLLIRGAPGRVAADLLGHQSEATTRITSTPF